MMSKISQILALNEALYQQIIVEKRLNFGFLKVRQ